MDRLYEYMEDVYSQLDEHATEEYKRNHITYTFSTELVNSNIDYFQRCMYRGLSAYKALLFFWDYLNENTDL